ncbi:MAG: LCP family protein [Chloroflexi bacterium]|nr:LCP family protein [Chloroflexota bacterium]
MKQRGFIGFVLITLVFFATWLSPRSNSPTENPSALSTEVFVPPAEILTELESPADFAAPPRPSPVTARAPESATAGEYKEFLKDKKGGAQSNSLFETLLKPFADEAQKRRDERARLDPQYAKRVDRALNDGRINFLLYGYGETHEPPATERAIIGSHSVFSYDTRTRVVDVVSFTHDIRAPEIEQIVYKDGKGRRAIRMDQAYNVGGMALNRQMIEDATGLSLDFQIVFKDMAMARAVDNAFGGVEIDNPFQFDVHPFYLEGKKYPAGTFLAGKQKLNGTQVLQFIKTVPITQGYYGRDLEHNYRKHLIFTALLESLARQGGDAGFWLKGSGFIAGELMKGAISYDFDPVPFAINNAQNIVPELRRYATNRRAGMGLPKINKTIYVVDPAHGDGGVQWVASNAYAGNVVAQKDIQEGVYPSLDYEIPIDGNPYGDLVTDYWFSVRKLVRKSLLGETPVAPIQSRYSPE